MEMVIMHIIKESHSYANGCTAFLATAHTFMEDNSGNIWITTNRGLFQAQMADLYDYLDGKINWYIITTMIKLPDF